MHEPTEAEATHRAFELQEQYHQRAAEQLAAAPSRPLGTADLAGEFGAYDALLGGHSPTDDDVTALAAGIAWVTCACGTQTLSLDPRTGRCVRCAERDELARQAVRRLRNARVPEPMWWVRGDHADLAQILGLPGHHEQLGRQLFALSELSRLRTITLMGDPCAGKSHLAVALMLPQIAGSLWIDASKLGALERTHKIGTGDGPPLIVQAYRARVLVLDDLGEAVDRRERRVITSLLQDRWNRGRRTIVTTGLTIAQLTEQWGDGIASRLGLEDDPRRRLGETKMWNLTEDRIAREERATLRRRRSEAEELRADGKGAAQIAEALGISEATVARWLDGFMSRPLGGVL